MFNLKGDRVRIGPKTLLKVGLSQLHIGFILALNKMIIILKAWKICTLENSLQISCNLSRVW